MMLERVRRGVERYAAVTRIPGAKALLVANFTGHVPVGMVTLTLLLGLGQNSGSYSTAGLAIGVYVIASGVTAPFWGRCVDHYGAGWVLTGMAFAFLLSSAVLAVAMAVNASVVVVLVTVTAAGLSRPVLAGAVQSLWSLMTASDEPLRKSAYALHAMQLGFVWILGPLVVTGIVAAFGSASGPVVAMAVSAVLTCAGALMVAFVWRRRRERPERDEVSAADRGPVALYTRAYFGLLASILLFEAALGAGFVTIGVFAERAGVPSATGVLVSVWFIGGMIGGAWFGVKRLSWPLHRQYRWLLAGLAAGYLVCVVLKAPWQLGIALFATGMVLSPTHTVQYSLIAGLSPHRSRTEGFTWLSTATGAGGALGSTLAGPAITHFDRTYTGFALAALCALAAACLALVLTGRTAPDVRPAEAASR